MQLLNELKDIIESVIDGVYPLPPKPIVNTSVELGQIGERDILQLLTTCFPSDIISDMTHIPHSTDIILETKDIVFAFECKNKLTITKEDVTKFNNDLKVLRTRYALPVIGVFMSIQANVRIPYKDFIDCDKDNESIYLTSDYISKENIQTLVKILPTLWKTHVDTIEYQFTPELLVFINAINEEYRSLDAEYSKYKSAIDTIINSTSTLQDLLIGTKRKMRFVNTIRQQMGEPALESSTIDIDILNVYDSCKGTFTKKGLIEMVSTQEMKTWLQVNTIANIKRKFTTLPQWPL